MCGVRLLGGPGRHHRLSRRPSRGCPQVRVSRTPGVIKSRDESRNGRRTSSWPFEEAPVTDPRDDRATDKDHSPITRRRMLQRASGLIATAAFSTKTPHVLALGQAGQGAAPLATADITGRRGPYMVAARDRNLPADVIREGKYRVLDTIGAMVSGARLKPGEAVIRFIRGQGGVRGASRLKTNIRTTAINAALANAMFGHSDEPDDFEPVTKAHPGCAVVPAALAMAERNGGSGIDVLKAVVLGYDLCCRFLMALGPDHVRAT